MYNTKTSSLSSIDQTLLKYNEIDYYSTSEAIYALQVKLQEKGCWTPITKVRNSDGTFSDVIIDTEDGIDFKPRVPSGVWDEQMQGDIFGFQVMNGLGQSKQGKCDNDTIHALIGDEYYYNGFYHQMRYNMGVL